MAKQVNVLVIDDSAYSRLVLTRLLESIQGVRVVGTASNGNEGIRQLKLLDPDLITLDLEMPNMDGFTFLRIVMSSFVKPILVISSRGSRSDVFKALELGAIDFIEKPSAVASTKLMDIREILEEKIRLIPHLKIEKIRKRRSAVVEDKTTPFVEEVVRDQLDVRVIAIGASTGGPPALSMVLPQLHKGLDVRVVVSQHMPAGFTRQFAERLNRLCDFDVREAVDGEEVQAGSILIAPGGYHLTFERKGGTVWTSLTPKSEEDTYTPSIDRMFSSASEVWGEGVLGVVLTGMGNDGRCGSVDIKENGGFIIAESQETAVVFGMPNSVISAGIADVVLPLHDLGKILVERSESKPLKRA